MSLLEIYLLAVFAAVWLVPLGLATSWEARRRRLTRQLANDSEEGRS